MLEGKRVFLDVGVALRAALFPESYSRKVLEHIERTRNVVAVISPHIRDEGLKVLSKAAPACRPEFVSYLRKLKDCKVLEEVPNGDPRSLKEWKSLGPDDDTVMASAIQSGCDLLVTLDEPFANQAAIRLAVLAPAELEWSQMRMVRDNPANPGVALLPELFLGPEAGTIIFQVQPIDGSTGYINKGGRRYVFTTDKGFACWLSEETWQYEFGYMDSHGAVATIPLIAREKKVRVGLTYNLATRECAIGAAVVGEIPEIKFIKKKSLPRNSMGRNLQLFGSPKGQEFSGTWQGALSAGEHHGLASFRFSVRHGSFFSPLDHLRSHLSGRFQNKNIWLSMGCWSTFRIASATS
jgi:predicted nucleic acid-binding protein